MSSTDRPPTDRPPNDRRSVRERAAQARAAQQAAERRRERTLRLVVVLVVVVVVVGIGVGVFLTQRSQQQSASAGGLPKGVTGTGGGVPYGPATGVPQLDLWEDFQCPACKVFEQSLGPTVKSLTDAGKVRVVYHPLSFLDRGQDTSSLRATAVGGCAADQDRFRDYHDVVYRNQPAEGVGYTDAQLVGFGRQAGLSGAALDAFSACAKAGTYTGWATQVQATMAENQITATPTLVLDGKKVDPSAITDGQQYSPGKLTQLVESAAAQG